MNIEELKKRKKLMETNLKGLREKITQDTQNMFRVEGALLDVQEIINEEEKKLKEEKEKEKDKVEKKKVK